MFAAIFRSRAEKSTDVKACDHRRTSPTDLGEMTEFLRREYQWRMWSDGLSAVNQTTAGLRSTLAWDTSDRTYLIERASERAPLFLQEARRTLCRRVGIDEPKAYVLLV